MKRLLASRPFLAGLFITGWACLLQADLADDLRAREANLKIEQKQRALDVVKGRLDVAGRELQEHCRKEPLFIAPKASPPGQLGEHDRRAATRMGASGQGDLRQGEESL